MSLAAMMVHVDVERASEQRVQLALALADEIGINVAAANVRETADGADDLAKTVRPLPRHGERTDRPGACAGDRAIVGIL